MSEPASTLTAEDIQHRTQEVVRLGAIGSELLGGATGAHRYLSNTLHYWLGIAIAQEGMTGACQLMEDALQTADLCAIQTNGCDHGRCAP